MVYFFGLLFFFLSTVNVELEAVKLRWEVIRIQNQGPHQLKNCLYQSSVDINDKIPSKSIFSGKLRHLLVGMNHSEAQTRVFHLGQVSRPVLVSTVLKRKPIILLYWLYRATNWMRITSFFINWSNRMLHQKT